MTERNHELNQRLAELFSGGSDSPPDEAAGSAAPIDATGPTPAAPPIESVARALAALPPDLWKTILPGATDQATDAPTVDNSQLLRLQTIVEATPIPILITRVADGRPLYVNARASAMFGVAREDLLDHTTLEFYDDAADRQKILGVLQREGRVSNYELRLKRGDGTRMWAMLDVQPLVYNGEHAVFSSFYDITARRQAEEQLRYSEALYQSLVEAIPENLCRKDRQGRFTYGNRPFCKLAGLSPEELAGKTDYDIYPPELAEKYRADDQAVMAGGKVVEFLEAHVVLGAGERADVARQNFVRTIKNPLYDARGQVTGIQIMFWDATEQALRESEERYRDLFDNASELIQGVAPDGKFVYVNRAWCEALGYAEAEVVSASAALSMFDIIHPEDRPHYTALFNRLMAGEQAGSLAARSRFVAKDGRIITVEGNISATVDKEGHAVAARGIFRDITDRQQIEAERERLLAAEARRAVQLQTGGEIASAAASILDPDKLLPVVVELICERYDLYYAGLFLIDATGQWAELRAGTGEAGRTMLEAHHRLAIGGASMIGRCAATGEARIALDVGAEAVRFDNPLLPRTRSEMALSLISRGQIIGALTIQSTRLVAFTPDDISALRTMAGQIATTIENARLFQETRQARAEAESRLLESQILQQFSRTVSSTLDIDHVLDAVVEILQHRLNLPYIAISLIDHEARRLTTVRGIGSASSLHGLARPLDTVQNDITMDIVRKGQIEVIDGWDDRFDRAIYEHGGHADLVRAFVPVRLRDKTLGLFEAGYRRGTRAHISPEEVRMLDGLADQLAVAIDNARLLNQVQAALAETGKLYTASRQLAAAPDLTSMVTIFAESVTVPDINRVVLWLFEFAAGTDELTAATVSAAWYSGQGEPPQPIGTRYSPEAMRAINLGRTTEPLFSNDLMNDPHIDPNSTALVRRLKIGAMAVLPLWAGGQQLGLLLLISEHTHIFVESEVRPLTALAQQMAVAIENRRLFEQMQRSAEREHAINRIASRLRNAQSVEQVLNIATQELRAATRSSVSVAEIAPQTAAPRPEVPANGNGHAAGSEA